MKKAGAEQNDIGSLLGRSLSTISRELCGNKAPILLEAAKNKYF